MDEDHLDREISVAAEFTGKGLNAKAKSRTLAAIDRLGGNLAEWFNTRLEKGNSMRRVDIDREQEVGSAITRQMVDVLSSSSESGQRALDLHFKQISRRQENKDAVLEQAIDDLREKPPTEAQAEAGGEELTSEFMDRFEQYADGASSEALRQKWGRVLSAEVRQPGTFSTKVLRIVDELEPDTAALFERLAVNRVGATLPGCLVGKIQFLNSAQLVGAGLLEDAGLGLQREFEEGTLQNGDKIWFCPLGNYAVAFPRSATGPFPNVSVNPTVALGTNGKTPVMPIQELTPVGRAITSILPNGEMAALKRLIEELRKVTPQVFAYRSNKSEPGWERFEI